MDLKRRLMAIPRDFGILKKKGWRKGKIIIVIVLLVIIGLGWYLSQRPRQLNVLLITIDALRPDHLGCYGYGRDTSPNIDRLARKGVLFTQAFAQGNQTFISVSSIITSTYPTTHGVRKAGDSLNLASFPTLTQVLKRNGYFNIAITNHGGIKTILGIEQGFNLFITVKNKADEITRQAMELLKDRRDRNFFLWLHYIDPHGPYTPPSPYNKIYLKDEFYKGDKHLPISSFEFGCYEHIPKYVAQNDITDVDYYISQYDGEIRFTDEQIGVLLKELKRLNLYKDTLIIISADHGEYLGGNNYYFAHAGPPYDESLKVPLIIKCDNLIPKGRVINHQVQSIDIAPTILDILRIDKNKIMEGTSLLSTILGGKHPSIYAFSSSRFFYNTVRTEQWKLIYADNRGYNTIDEKEMFTTLLNRHSGKDCNESEWYELYNLEKDPGELNDLYEVEKEKFEFLRYKLDNWLSQKSKLPKTKTGQHLDEEIKERLRTLGYLQ